MYGLIVSLAVFGQQQWQEANVVHLRYELTNTSSQEIDLGSLRVYVTATVSNSSIPGNESPREYHAELDAQTKCVEVPVLSKSNLPKDNCSEKITMKVDSGKVPPGGEFAVDLAFSHNHYVYRYDPLLGTRTIDIECGPYKFRRQSEIDKVRPYNPPVGRYDPPADKTNKDDPKHADCVYLAVTDEHSDRYVVFENRPARHSTKYKLTYEYFIFAGSNRELVVKVCNLFDNKSYHSLSDTYALYESLTAEGKWIKFEKTFTTKSDCIGLSLDIRFSSLITSENAGEAYIRNIRIDPVVAVGP